jgi:hypothetical protein
MAVPITAATFDQLTSKLEAFSATLSDQERTLFKSMLESPELSDKDLDKVVGGFSAMPISSGPLTSSFFRQKLMCW